MQLDFPDGVHSPARGRPAWRAGAFTDNMKLPVHRWFRYSAGFSAEWVEATIGGVSTHSDAPVRVLDPFCGSGTALIAASRVGAAAVGFETHPFIARIAEAKLNWNVDPEVFEATATEVLNEAVNSRKTAPASSAPLMRQCYSAENLVKLEALRDAWEKKVNGRSPDRVEALVRLAITGILRECSGVGTAQWQYVLPNRNKAHVSAPFEAFRSRVDMFLGDMFYARNRFTGSGEVVRTDARKPDHAGEFDLVVTSPPYPNNYDYADATRLEMTFWEEVSSWGDLQGAVRRHLIRSCSQHAAAEKLILAELLDDPAIAPIVDELKPVCEELGVARQGKGGKKTYHTMVAAYFVDLAKTWNALRGLVRDGGQAVFMIGDSAPYGIYVPCDEWLGKLALAAGFRSWKFEKVRNRNTKWKNRKHRVPLKEGVLRVAA